MQTFLIFFLQTFLIISGDKIVDLIKAAKYPVELHHVQTSDGFKLSLHRIPSDNESSREPVFLMHGMGCSAVVWVFMNPKKGLGYMLADAGYDVWMLSARGTSYSSSHKSLDAQSKDFWDYSWHEIGYYDVPEAINYILAKTKQKKVKYVGHSQGCTVFAVALTTHPNLNQKISTAFLLTPAIFMHHTMFLLKSLSPLYQVMQIFTDLFQMYGLQIKSNSVYKTIFDMACQDGNITNNFCKEIVFRFIGKDSGQWQESIIAMTVNDVIDDIAVKQVAHFAQVVLSEKFAMFDYGPDENKIRYKSFKAPEYNLTKIKVPITVFYGINDAIVNPTDVKMFISKLPNVRQTIKLPWNHLDFVIAEDIDVRLNQIIIRKMRT